MSCCPLLEKACHRVAVVDVFPFIRPVVVRRQSPLHQRFSLVALSVAGRSILQLILSSIYSGRFRAKSNGIGDSSSWPAIRRGVAGEIGSVFVSCEGGNGSLDGQLNLAFL